MIIGNVCEEIHMLDENREYVRGYRCWMRTRRACVNVLDAQCYNTQNI